MPAEDDKVKLGWKDYLALFIASLETIMLPALVFIILILLLLAYSSFVK